MSSGSVSEFHGSITEAGVSQDGSAVEPGPAHLCLFSLLQLPAPATLFWPVNLPGPPVNQLIH